MKLSLRTEWPYWALIAAMFIASAVVWPMVPDRFPMHFNWQGQVDHWGSRSEAAVPLLMTPVTCIFVYVLLLLVPLIDPGRANYGQFGTAYWVIRFIVLAHLAVLHTVVLLATLGHEIDIARIMLLSVGVLFILLGSVMGKVRPNWFVGVRTPWTLSSKLSWTHSQRAGGWMFIALGLFTLLAALLPVPWNIVTVLSASLLGTAAVMLYSYFIWRQDRDRVPPSRTSPADD